MSRLMTATVAAAAVASGIVAPACSSGDGAGPAGTGSPQLAVARTQSVEVDGITVEVTWLEPDAGGVDIDLGGYAPDEHVFLNVVLDTHSGDLNEIDVEQAVELRQGGVTWEPEEWISESDDSHHRAGVLVFPHELEDGAVTLALDLDGKQAELTWQEPP